MKFTGYYLGLPKPYMDHVAGGNKRTGLICIALCFSENGVVVRQTKEDNSEVISFKQSDFRNGYPGEYSVLGDLLHVVFDKGKEWELRTIYKISGNLITSVESNSASGVGHVYKFQEF